MSSWSERSSLREFCGSASSVEVTEVAAVAVVVAVLAVAVVGEGSSSITGCSCDGENGVCRRRGDAPDAAGEADDEAVNSGGTIGRKLVLLKVALGDCDNQEAASTEVPKSWWSANEVETGTVKEMSVAKDSRVESGKSRQGDSSGRDDGERRGHQDGGGGGGLQEK